MNKEQSILVRFTTVALLLVLVFPLPVLADPSVTVNGTNLPHSASFANSLVASSTVLTNPWSVFVLYDTDQPATPTARDGTPGEGFTNGTTQTVGDCGDGALTTWCFTYTPPANVEAAVFWFFDISDAGGTYRFILDTGGPILKTSDGLSDTIDPIANNVVLPTISGSSSYTSTSIVDIEIASTATTTRVYQTTSSGGLWSYTLQSGDELPNGTYTVTASSTDQYNNRGAEVSGTFVIDTSAPTVAITSGPADGSYASSSPVSFGFTVTDATTTTALCSWDGDAGATCSSPATSTLADGSHTFSVSATDAYNNTGATTTRSFTLDTAAPALAEVAVIATSTDTTPDYSFTSAEAGTLGFSGACSAATSTIGVGTTTITFAELAVGSYSSCSLSVIDAAGNTGTLAISPFAIEAVPEPPAPAPSSSGGGSGGNGIIGGPLSVGYQIPYLPPPLPTPPLSVPEPQPVQVTVGASTGGLAVATPVPAAPTQTRTSDVREISNAQTQAAPAPAAPSVRAPVAVVTPWDTPAGKQINLAAAAATGFQLPSWIIILAALLLLAFIGYLFLWRRV